MERPPRKKNQTASDQTERLISMNSRLSSYGLAAGALLASGAAVRGDIVVWDPNPDPVAQQNSAVWFDLLSGNSGNNNFGGAQFKLSKTSFAGTFTTCIMTSSGSQCGVVYPYHKKLAFIAPQQNGAKFVTRFSNADRLSTGAAVGASKSFADFMQGIGGSSTRNGAPGQTFGWWGRGDHGYLGLKFTDQSGDHFGWAELQIEQNFNVKLLRFAYETDANRTILAGQTFDPLELKSAVSRKMHGSTNYDVALPLTGQPGVECRQAGNPSATTALDRADAPSSNTHTLIFTFNNNISSGNAEMSNGVGSISSVSTSGDKTMTVELSGVADAQQITIVLKNVTDSVNNQVLADTPVSMIVLLGDTTGNKTVNGTDVSQTKLQSGHQLSETNFREDVTVSGGINGSDVSAVKLRSGNGIPGAPLSSKANRDRLLRK